MTSANVSNLGSVKQNRPVTSDMKAGRQKADKPGAIAVFAALMNDNYSTQLTSDAAKRELPEKSAEQASAMNDYERYQYRENEIEPAGNQAILDKISDSSEELADFEDQVVSIVAEQLGMDEDAVRATLEELGLTVFDLLEPQNLVQFMTQLTEGTTPMDILVDPQFLNLMQEVEQAGNQLMEELAISPKEMDELIQQMDILENPEPLTEEEPVQTQQPEETAQTVLPELTEAPEEVTEGTREMQETAETVNQTPKEQTEEPNSRTEETKEVSPEAEEAGTVENREQKDTKEFSEQKDDGTAESQRPQKAESVTTERTNPGEQQPEITFTVNEMAVDETVQTPTNASYLSVDTMNIIEQIVENVKVGIADGTSTMEMQLNPENLGKIFLHISAKEGVVNAQIAASNEAVKEALETQIADLRANLSQAGVKVDAIEVTVASHEFEKNLEQNQSREKQEGERQEEKSTRRRNINLSEEEISHILTEEEALVAQIMRDNGNSVDMTV